jgi:heptosyltransferase I
MAKILIVRLGAMGDILHALPAVTGIRAALPDATIGWLVDEKWTELLAAPANVCPPEATCQQKPVANLIHTVNMKRWRSALLHPTTLKEFRAAVKAVRAVHYDVALDFQGAIRSALFASIGGAARTAGFTDPRESLARFLYSERFPRPGDHVIEQNYAFAALALKDYLEEKQFHLLAPQLPHDPAAESWAESEIMRLGIASFAIMNPGAGWAAKQWPPERYGQVAQALALHNLKTLVNAAPGEEALARAVIDASKGNAFVISCTIGQLIALTRRARLFVGGDTGPLHLAAALGVPVVGLFGPTDPARTGPFGTKAAVLRHEESKTTFSHHQQPEEGLLKISAEETIAAARRLLGSSHA